MMNMASIITVSGVNGKHDEKTGGFTNSTNWQVYWSSFYPYVCGLPSSSDIARGNTEYCTSDDMGDFC